MYRGRKVSPRFVERGGWQGTTTGCGKESCNCKGSCCTFLNSKRFLISARPWHKGKPEVVSTSHSPSLASPKLETPETGTRRSGSHLDALWGTNSSFGRLVFFGCYPLFCECKGTPQGKPQVWGCPKKRTRPFVPIGAHVSQSLVSN